MVNLGDFNLTDSSKKSKTKKKYYEIDNHFRGVRSRVDKCWSSNLQVDGLIPALAN